VYRTCLFCKKPLGSNEVIESFPVGRRLAFDSAKGRLWVVCTKCNRWNLTPLEERWEAVEACERMFRETPMRASTENVGIARHREGLDLVRIGEPERGEFAAWRYGDQFRGRYRKAVVAPFLGFGLGMAITSLPLAIPVGVSAMSGAAAIAWSRMRTVAKVRIGGDASGGGPVEPRDVAPSGSVPSVHSGCSRPTRNPASESKSARAGARPGSWVRTPAAWPVRSFPN